MGETIGIVFLVVLLGPVFLSIAWAFVIGPLLAGAKVVESVTAHKSSQAEGQHSNRSPSTLSPIRDGRVSTQADRHEQQLVEQYACAYSQMGIALPEAWQRALEFVQAGIEEVAARGWQEQPDGYGDVLLREEQSNEQVASALSRRRSAGATNDDIRWWWNMPALDRVLIEKSDEQARVAAFVAFLHQGMDGDVAAQSAFKLHPKYGSSSDEVDEDGPLPIELKRRVMDWLERQQASPDLLRNKLETATSFNALVRAEMSEGRL